MQIYIYTNYSRQHERAEGPPSQSELDLRDLAVGELPPQPDRAELPSELRDPLQSDVLLPGRDQARLPRPLRPRRLEHYGRVPPPRCERGQTARKSKTYRNLSTNYLTQKSNRKV